VLEAQSFSHEHSNKYKQENPLLLKKGHLEYLLTEANKTFNRLVIQFAGLYDTVPHQGFHQSNDVKDLGLNSINQADYVVHLVADDEHRLNFSLVNISSVKKVSPDSGEKGGIELYLPEVHCDVGGSYVEGRPENNKRIDAFFSYQKLKELKQELIAQGWFKNHELTMYDNYQEITDKNYHEAKTKVILNSTREYLSNQYSFIPLHIMVDFCLKKQVPIDDSTVLKNYNFRDIKAILENIKFLNNIETKLHKYAFEGGEKYVFEEPQTFTQPDIVYDPQHATKALQEYEERQITGQKQLDEAIALKNKDIKFLRNNYLHWNSVYGQDDVVDEIAQPHKPNIDENGKRKRHIR